ncbi:MAG: hypothetical protein ABI220_02000 [Candidatus Saccharimonadales bacterium]
MNTKFNALRRPALTVIAAIVGLSGLLPAVFSATAAAAQMTTRGIKMSDSTPGATNVKYTLFFTPATNAAEIVIDFCSNDPIDGDVCDFAVDGTPNVSSATGTGVAVVGAVAPVHTLKITGLTLQAGVPFSTEISGITNPTATSSDTNTFYARIYTYATSGAAAYTVSPSSGTKPTSVGSPIDVGGAALSVAENIQITAKVMETLTFCTSGTDISGANYGGAGGDTSCAQATAPLITIGHGTPTQVLSADQVDNTPAYMQLSTNASTGAIVRMKNGNTCDGLSNDGGATCKIPSMNSSSTPAAIVPGTAAFGLFVAPSVTTASVTTSTGTITPDPVYNNGTNTTVQANTSAATTAFYGMDDSNVLSTYGSTIASCAGPISQVNSQLNFAATSALTTPAGIYTTNEILIATGTF